MARSIAKAFEVVLIERVDSAEGGDGHFVAASPAVAVADVQHDRKRALAERVGLTPRFGEVDVREDDGPAIRM